MNVSIKSRFFAVILALVLIVTALPVSAGMKKDDGEFKVLFIGNSYSDDVTDGGYFEDSTLYNIMKSMVGDREIGVGLLWSGGKTMAWHASMAKQDLPYSFFYTDSSDGWSYVGGRTQKALFPRLCPEVKLFSLPRSSRRPYGNNPEWEAFSAERKLP